MHNNTDIQAKVEAYNEFLISKIRVAEKHGIAIDASLLHQSTKPHQIAIIKWGCELGAALVAPDCGLGKTHISLETERMILKEFGGKGLIVTELGASETYINEDPAVGEGARLGIKVEYVQNQEQANNSPCDIVVTNYERVRMGCFDFSEFTVVWLDEGNYIKNIASETTDALARQLKNVKYKYIASATPSPNETLELVNYAHILGIADRGQILTQFFQRNSTKAGDLTLHPQHIADFWLWVHSWMVAIEYPSDLGFSDEGYTLPKLNIHWIEVPLSKAVDAGTEKNGQQRMFLKTGNSLPDNAKLKQQSIDVRLKKAMEIVDTFSNDHFLLWHHINPERDALIKTFKGRNFSHLTGSQSVDIREKAIVDFTKGNLQYLATKPEISGVGCNFQKFCGKAVLIGVNNDFNLLYQMLKRIHRPYSGFDEVDFFIIYLPEEYPIIQNLRRKWNQHNEQREWLRDLVRVHGLDHAAMIEERKRTFKTNRKVFQGKSWTLIGNDCTREWMDVEDNSIDFQNSSFPFGNHYEYTNYYNDYGHNISNSQFARQLDFFLPEYFRTLKPGRISTVHLKNRIHYGSVTGKGFSVFHRFTHLVCEAMEKHGFETMGFHYIPTCVVGENNQTYRLTYGEMQKDSTKMGAGIPEEIWVFRKPPTTTENAYADVPVTHNCECPLCHDRKDYASYARPNSILLSCPKCNQFFHEKDLIHHSDYQMTLAQWQIDADAFWQSSGDRLITPAEMAKWDLKKIRKWWNEFNPNVVYDYRAHIQLLQELEGNGKLSKEFTTLPLISNSSYIWNNVNRMHGLNLEQSRRKERNHICPQPYDEVDRVIELYSNEGELIADPFNGLGTTGVRALKKKRRYFGTELNDQYAEHSAFYLKKEEEKVVIPTLFDLIKEVS